MSYWLDQILYCQHEVKRMDLLCVSGIEDGLVLSPHWEYNNCQLCALRNAQINMSVECHGSLFTSARQSLGMNALAILATAVLCQMLFLLIFILLRLKIYFYFKVRAHDCTAIICVLYNYLFSLLYGRMASVAFTLQDVSSSHAQVKIFLKFLV